jgi:hypothetical protein
MFADPRYRLRALSQRSAEARRLLPFNFRDVVDINRRPTMYWTISVGEKYLHPEIPASAPGRPSPA